MKARFPNIPHFVKYDRAAQQCNNTAHYFMRFVIKSF